MKKGLDKDQIIAASLALIEAEGAASFSLHRLAGRLGIKTASLYNHVSGLDGLMTAVSVEVIHQLVAAEKAAITGKTGDAAICALAEAYLQFGLDHYELYKIFMGSRKPGNEVLEREGVHILDPIMTAFSGIELSDDEKIHWERILRSLIHGFISQEKAGFFTFGYISCRESFHKAITCFLAGIHQEESVCRERRCASCGKH